MIFGVSEPILFAMILVIVIFIIKVLPFLLTQKQTTDYTNFNMQQSNAYWTFAGISGAGYTNVKLDPQRKPVYHGDGTYDIYLEGFDLPLRNVQANKLSDRCNVKLRETAETILGIKVDVLCNIDANSISHEWDSAWVNNWEVYRDRLTQNAKTKLTDDTLRSKELSDEIEGVKNTTSMSSSNLLGEE